MDTPAKLLAFIATRDRRVAIKAWNANAISQHWQELLDFGKVVVGGRTTCGSKVDPSWIEFTAWNEVVVKARQFGIHIDVEPIKHGNAWATKCGGFWDENRYTFRVQK